MKQTEVRLEKNEEEKRPEREEELKKQSKELTQMGRKMRNMDTGGKAINQMMLTTNLAIF